MKSGIGFQAILLGLGCAIMIVVMQTTGPWVKLEMLALDALMRHRAEREIDSRITLIVVDNETVRSLGYPVPRHFYASLVMTAKKYGARAVGFDVLFLDEGPAADDARLAAAVAQTGIVVLPGDHHPVVPETRDTKTGLVKVASVLPVGSVAADSRFRAHLKTDSRIDGNHRRVPIALQGDQVIPTLALEVLRVGYGVENLELELKGESLWVKDLGELGERRFPVDDLGHAMINFRTSRPPATRTFSLRDILQATLDVGNEVSDVRLRNAFSNQLVLVGYTASALGDIGQIPLSDYDVPLVMVHANALSNMLQDDFLNPVAISIRQVLVIVLCLGIALWVMWASILWSALASFLSIVTLWATAYVLYASDGLYLDPMTPSMAIALTYLGTTVYRQLVVERHERQARKIFARFVAPNVLEQLLSQKGAIQLQGKRKVMTMLFSDIRGYTALSNKEDPREVVDVLRTYLAAMADVILKFEGTIGCFMGDGVFAFFGDPIYFEDHALRAVQCSMAMHDELESLNKKWEGEGRIPLQIRVGIATGEVYVGNFGSKNYVEYSAIGPATNLASRLESRARPGTTLVSEATHEAICTEYACRFVDRLQLKGFERPQKAYEVGRGVAVSDVVKVDPRKHPRVPLTVGAQLVADGVSHEVQTVNISAGGMFVACKEEIALNTEVKLSLDIPIGDGLVAVEVLGRLVHAGVDADGGHGYGVCFSDFRAVSTEAIEYLVELILERRQLLGGNQERHEPESASYLRFERQDLGLDEGDADPA
jgi:adenylate cyclase